jgi:hypothetical protein
VWRILSYLSCSDSWFRLSDGAESTSRRLIKFITAEAQVYFVGFWSGL